MDDDHVRAVNQVKESLLRLTNISRSSLASLICFMHWSRDETYQYTSSICWVSMFGDYIPSKELLKSVMGFIIWF